MYNQERCCCAWRSSVNGWLEGWLEGENETINISPFFWLQAGGHQATTHGGGKNPLRGYAGNLFFSLRQSYFRPLRRIRAKNVVFLHISRRHSDGPPGEMDTVESLTLLCFCDLVSATRPALRSRFFALYGGKGGKGLSKKLWW